MLLEMSILVKKILMKKKQCTKCKEWKQETEFFKDKQKSSGYRPDCKTCNTKRSTKWQIENKDKRASIQLKHQFGIKLDDYNKMLEKQNSKCAICTKDITEFKTRFHVDHCHKTGNIRALLCVNCNHGLGAFMDNEELLTKAKDYLNGFKNSSYK